MCYHLAGHDATADWDIGFADKMAIAYCEISMTEFDEVAGTIVITDMCHFSGEHCVNRCSRLGRQIHTIMLLGILLSEWISAVPES